MIVLCSGKNHCFCTIKLLYFIICCSFFVFKFFIVYLTWMSLNVAHYLLELKKKIPIRLIDSFWVECFFIFNYNFFFFKTKNNNCINTFYVNKGDLFFFFSFLKVLFPSFYFFVFDIYSLFLKDLCFLLNYNLSSFFNFLSFSVFCETYKNAFSISSKFKSVVWLEREVKEFSTIYFYNLFDTRRLLTDYILSNSLNFINLDTNYKYSNLFYDI